APTLPRHAPTVPCRRWTRRDRASPYDNTRALPSQQIRRAPAVRRPGGTGRVTTADARCDSRRDGVIPVESDVRTLTAGALCSGRRRGRTPPFSFPDPGY